jgi:spore coat protein A, manganese oxidase
LISRRCFLEQSSVVAAGLTLNRIGAAVARAAPPLVLDPANLTPYVDRLPIPEIARSHESRPDPTNPAARLPFYRMAMREFKYRVHRDLPPTTMWGFESISPGPTFETRSGEGLLVEWVNELPAKHFLPVDHSLHGAEADKPEVRSVVHLHGGKTPPESDGYPESWYVSGQSAVCHYPNQQDAALLFYHDHTVGINRLNIYAGLQGLCIIRDAFEDALRLPAGRHEIPLLLYDRSFTADGQLHYPVSGNPSSPWVPEVYGDSVLVNGKLFPYLDVEPCLYRFRILNGSNARFYRIAFGHGLELHQIGSDQGLLSVPVPEKRVVLSPGERADVLFDFSAYGGENILLRSDTFEMMQFRVAKTGVPGDRNVPKTLRPVHQIQESQSVRTRRLTLNEKTRQMASGNAAPLERREDSTRSMGMLLNESPWHMPITERPVIDTVEIWELVNLTEDAHPIHLHMVRFQLLDRRPFDVSLYREKHDVRFTGPAVLNHATEAGWKDTVRADPGEVTRIIVPFTGFVGRYVWHCHILEHEDNDMMRPYEVIAYEEERRMSDQATTTIHKAVQLSAS